MEIKTVEVQELLLKLTQVLKPLAQGDFSKKKEEEITPLAKHIFSPPSRAHKAFSSESEVRILPNLQTARAQMTKWVPDGKGPPPKAKPSAESPISLTHQAKHVLAQVRVAIQMLSSSSNLGKPEEKVLRQALERLKPYVDELIEAVSRKEMTPSENRPPTFRPLPKSPREHLLKKLLPFPSFKEESEKPLPKASRSPEKSAPLFPSKSSLPLKPMKEPLVDPKIAPEQKPPLPVSEKTSLPAAPYLPEKSPSQKRPKKKKKKSPLWRDPEDLDNR